MEKKKWLHLREPSRTCRNFIVCCYGNKWPSVPVKTGQKGVRHHRCFKWSEVPIERRTGHRVCLSAVIKCHLKCLPSYHCCLPRPNVVQSCRLWMKAWSLTELVTGCSNCFNDVERILKLTGDVSNCSLLLWGLLFPARMNTWFLACC